MRRLLQPVFVLVLSLATTLVQDGIRFGTIEHLLSALMGLEVEHLLIETDGEELPILDGSARPWVEAIQRAGIAQLPGRRRFIRIAPTGCNVTRAPGWG